MLSYARKLKKSGKLGDFEGTCDALIDSLVKAIDRAEINEIEQREQKRRREAESREPKVRRCYCQYRVGGLCGYYSTDSYKAECKYINDPGQCATALTSHGLAFEFE